MRIGVIGGTGPAGQGIAARLSAAGHDVVLGSRDAAKAADVVDALLARWDAQLGSLHPAANGDAARADLVVLATVADATVDTAVAHADQLAGKIVVVVANGVERGPRELRPVLPAEGSISAAVQKAVPDARVVTALQHIPAAALADPDRELDGDVLVASDDDEARAAVIALVETMGSLRALDAGSLANSVGIEAFTAALITVNIRHKGEAHVRLHGIDGRPQGTS